MALPGNTWNQVLQQIATDFQRLDLTTPTTALVTDPSWIYGIQAVQFWQPKIWLPGQAYNQWCSTFAYQNLYALPVDFEDDMQILQNQFGRILPLIKISEYEMNQKDVVIPPVIGQAINYCIFGNAAQYYGNVSATWQANFNYTSIYNSNEQPYPPYLILDSNNNVTALSGIYGNGTSAGTHPVWPTVPGQTVVDGNTTNGLQWQCWFNMSNAGAPLLRLWPWPDQAYTMTCVYQNIIPVPATAATSNFWAVEAEPMIRFWTEGLLRKNYMREGDFQNDFDTAMIEFARVSGRVRQVSAKGRARPCYL